MRATLEQLKAMNDSALYNHWIGGAFPFDYAVACHQCATMHRAGCAFAGHELFAAEATRVFNWNGGEETTAVRLRSVLEELYALRLFHDSLYPQPMEAVEEKTIAELAPSLVTQG